MSSLPVRTLPAAELVDGVPPGMPVMPVLTFAATTPDPLAVVSVGAATGTVLLWANAAFCTAFGFHPDNVFEVAPDSIGPDDVGAMSDAQRGRWHEQVEFDITRRVERRCTLTRLDGSRFPATVTTLPVGGADAAVWAVSVREDTDARRAEEHLSASEARFRALADQAPVGIFASEIGLRLAYVNRRFVEVFGVPTDEVLGTGWLGLVDDDDRDLVLSGLERVLCGESVEMRVTLAGGRGAVVDLRVVPATTPSGGAGFVGTIDDVTERLSWEHTLRHQARHDALTGLLNREGILDVIEEALARAREDGPAFALLFLDLDDFKLVNDSLGHDAGDELLVQVADRLVDAVRVDDVVARFGGDEFVVLCPGPVTDRGALRLAERLRAALTCTISIAGVDTGVSASIGVAVADRTVHRSASEVLRDADIAMYQAKAGGRGCAALFDGDARDVQRERLFLLSELRYALDHDLLDVAYQPIVDLATGRVQAVEALARWNHPERGAIPPDRFIPVAEASGLIQRLGTWVLRQAAMRIREWETALGPARPDHVAVNVSTLQLRRPSFVGQVREVLTTTGVDPERLSLELTESALLEDPAAARRTLLELRDLGVRLAIDDFGTGYSSLAYLRRLPVDSVKIDKGFVSGSDTAHDDAIVRAVLGLADSLHLEAIAEGVETAGQREWLHDLGCPLAQGYFFSRPRLHRDLQPLLTSALASGLPLSVEEGR